MKDKKNTIISTYYRPTLNMLSTDTTIYTGVTGISYGFLRLYQLTQEDHYLEIALELSAKVHGTFSMHDFDVSQPFVSKDTLERSFYFGMPGNLIGRDLILTQAGNTSNIDFFKLLDCRAQCSTLLELFFGKTGILNGFLILTNSLNDCEKGVKKELCLASEDLFKEILDDNVWNTPINLSQLKMLGTAHGWCGLLYVSLKMYKNFELQIPVKLQQRLDEFFALSESDNGCAFWPVHSNQEKLHPGWCNGTPGHLMLCTLAYSRIKKQQYLEIAERAGRTIAETYKLMTNGTLCCGLTGQLYAIINLYNLTKDKKWILLSKEMYKFGKSLSFDPNGGLYKGRLAFDLLEFLLEDTSKCIFPLFE